MSPNELLLKIIQDMHDIYQSLDNPRFDFVEKYYEEKLYENLVGQFLNTAKFIEFTDLNDDVCRSFLIEDPVRNINLTLQLSFIGKYAVFFRDKEVRNKIFIETSSDVSNDLEKTVYDNLIKSDFIFLGKYILTRPIKLSLFNTENPSVYQGLFSDVEYIPGEYKSEK